MTDLNVNMDISGKLEEIHDIHTERAATSKFSRAELKSTHSLKLIGRRWRLDLQRYAYDLEQLDATSKTINEQCSAMYRKTREEAEKRNKPICEHYVAGIKRLAKTSQRHYQRIRMQAESVLNTSKKLFGDLSADHLDEKFKQIMRIPQHEFIKFNKMTAEEREVRLLALMDEYGAGTKNGGFAEAEMNQPGFYQNGYMLDNRQEKDGSKRRPQFIHEIISRLIYGCIHPEKHKEVFFQRTQKEVKKWGSKHRQMRSEGRFAMVRVLIVLLPYLDFKKSLRIGYLDKSGEFLGICRKEIAKRAGISFESVKNAIKALEEQCLIHKGKQRREETERNGVKGFKGLAVVRCASANLIVRLGLGERWINRERKVDSKGANTMSDDETSLRDSLDYARVHPEQFSNQEIASLEIKLALL